MRIFGRRAAIGAAMSLVLGTGALAQGGAVVVSTPWTRAAGAGATGVGYMSIRNAGPTDRIVAARSPAARVVELHTHIRDGDVMRMRPVPAIDLPAGGEVRLAPGGLHLMLIGLVAPLRRGERVPLTLVLERGGEIQVELAVEAAGARGPSAAHRH